MTLFVDLFRLQIKKYNAEVLANLNSFDEEDKKNPTGVGFVVL
ncbi:hypothetical protein [Labilibaculum euxinus]